MRPIDIKKFDVSSKGTNNQQLALVIVKSIVSKLTLVLRKSRGSAR